MNILQGSPDRINSKDCGQAEPLARLIRGKKIRKTQVPWIVRLISSPQNRPYQLLCGGSIITRRIILTAAHCVEKPIESVEVFYNSSKLSEGPSIQAKAVVIHPGYRENMVSSDIALLKLETPLKIDKFVRPVCLPTKWTRVKQRRLIAAGWGSTREGGVASEDLLHVRLKRLPSGKCKKLIPPATAARINISTIICAWTKKKDICDGDSGGPLTGLNRKGKTVQLGIAAFNYACTSPLTPTAFTRVSSFMPWIRRMIRSERFWAPLDTTQEPPSFFSSTIPTVTSSDVMPLFKSTCLEHTAGFSDSNNSAKSLPY
ncbi:chymotrypsin-1-like [Amblyomma americanum]